jgi:hypothetical protein
MSIVIVTSDSGGTVIKTASERYSAPAGIIALALPLKSTGNCE